MGTTSFQNLKSKNFISHKSYLISVSKDYRKQAYS